MAPFLHPSHRTGRADFAHPALERDLYNLKRMVALLGVGLLIEAMAA